MSVFGSFSGPYFPTFGLDTEIHIEYITVFSLKTEKYGPEKLQIQTLFT